MSTTVRIPSGWFWMGAGGKHPTEAPLHRVFVGEFELAATAVTRFEYSIFLAETNHTFPRGWQDPAFLDPAQPVVGVSWFDSKAYCRWRSELDGFRWRLPTEAEWEKASRGGNVQAEYSWGHTHPDRLEYYQGAWEGPRPVAQGAQNTYGLFNMGDNVHEWCQDWYGPDYYRISPDRNPAGPEAGSRRVSRGGSWRHEVKASRCAHRSSLPPAYRYTDYGFRLVRESRTGA